MTRDFSARSHWQSRQDSWMIKRARQLLKWLIKTVSSKINNKMEQVKMWCITWLATRLIAVKRHKWSKEDTLNFSALTKYSRLCGGVPAGPLTLLLAIFTRTRSVGDSTRRWARFSCRKVSLDLYRRWAATRPWFETSHVILWVTAAPSAVCSTRPAAVESASVLGSSERKNQRGSLSALRYERTTTSLTWSLALMRGGSRAGAGLVSSR